MDLFTSSKSLATRRRRTAFVITIITGECSLECIKLNLRATTTTMTQRQAIVHDFCVFNEPFSTVRSGVLFRAERE